MARKVFISFLGTSPYTECIYDVFGHHSEPVRFVQEALITDICKEWCEQDRIFIFCTSKESTGKLGSKESNWIDHDGNIGLENRLRMLKGSGLKPEYEEIDIKAGFFEGEIWQVFDTVFSVLREGDQIYFDVTHAFRSIPLFSVVLFNYSKYMIGTRLERIMYGAFESLGPAREVASWPLEERIVPIVDLTSIARLQEYNQITSGLKDFGKIKQINNAIEQARSDKADSAVQVLSKSISQLDEYIATIDLKKIKQGKFIIRFRNSYKNLRRKNIFAKPISNLLCNLYEETADFVGGEDYKNIEAAINWTLKHDMLMQAYPLAAEYIISRVADKFKALKPKKESDKNFRMMISSLLGMPEEDFSSKNWDGKLKDFPNIAEKISEEKIIKVLRPKYDPIRSARNSLAHGNGAIGYDELRKGIQNIIECLKYFNPDYENYSSTQHIKKQYVP